MENKNEIIVYGADWCGDCHRAKFTLDNLKIAYKYINVDNDKSGMDFVIKTNDGMQSIPVLLFPSGKTLTEPNSEEIYNQLLEEGFIVAENK